MVCLYRPNFSIFWIFPVGFAVRTHAFPPMLYYAEQVASNEQSVTLSADTEGKYLTCQWLRNGHDISGPTNQEFSISDANSNLHIGNCSVRISNDFGHVSTAELFSFPIFEPH